LAATIAHVLAHNLEKCSGAVIPYGLLYLLDPSEINQCASARFGRRKTSSDLLVSRHLHVGSKFVIQFAINLLFSEKIG
jgi:hypothetical protein